MKSENFPSPIKVNAILIILLFLFFIPLTVLQTKHSQIIEQFASPLPSPTPTSVILSPTPTVMAVRHAHGL